MSEMLYYMTRPEELKKQPTALPMFREIAQHAGTFEQRSAAFHALWSFWNFEHAFDDLLDESTLSVEQKESALQLLYDFVGDVLAGSCGATAGASFRELYEGLCRESGWSDERKGLAVQALYSFAGNLTGNPFYRDHAREHKAMFDMIICRAIDGDAMLHEGAKRAALAPAVRCGDVDFIIHCAKLVGGWDLMRRIGRLRDYDTE